VHPLGRRRDVDDGGDDRWLSALPHDLTTSGSAINTVTQRVSAALGLAGLTVLATSQQAQMAAGRAALLDQRQAAHLQLL
jgi:hypothetical protein